MAVKGNVNEREQTYLIATYADASPTNLQTNWVRWLKDGSQVGASTMSWQQRWMKLIANSKGS